MFFSVYIIFDFMNRFNRVIYRKKYIYIISFFLCTFTLILAQSIIKSLIINIIIIFLITMIIEHYLYNDKKIYILYLGLYIVFIIAAQTLASHIFQYLILSGMVSFYNFTIEALAGNIFIQFFTFTLSRTFITFYKNKDIKTFTKVQFFNFLLLPIFSMFYIITLTSYMVSYLVLGDFIVLIINIGSIIFLNIFITNVFQSISKNNEMKNKLMLYDQQAKMQYEYYNSLEEKYKNSRKIIHDIKNHIYTMESLYKIESKGKVKDYNEELNEIFKALEQKIYTNNKVLNIIINDKNQLAEKLNINLISSIEDVDLSFIKDIDLTTIFANILDNAIDEVRHFEKNKEIYLKVERFNDFIIINARNKLKTKPIKKNNDFTTTKKNHSGLGLQNVKITIEKYNGDLRIDFNENEFKVNIVIPIN